MQITSLSGCLGDVHAVEVGRLTHLGGHELVTAAAVVLNHPHLDGPSELAGDGVEV